MHENGNKSLRLLHIVVQPVLVWDDGEEITPGPQVDSFAATLSQLDGVAERLRAELSVLADSLSKSDPKPA